MLRDTPLEISLHVHSRRHHLLAKIRLRRNYRQCIVLASSLLDHGDSRFITGINHQFSLLCALLIIAVFIAVTTATLARPTKSKDFDDRIVTDTGCPPEMPNIVKVKLIAPNPAVSSKRSSSNIS
eukprot:IDg11759t1